MRFHRSVAAAFPAGCLAAALALAGCSGTLRPAPQANAEGGADGTRRSFKGWELYAWPEGPDWKYSLLPGTNRLKSDDEIAASDARLENLDQVKQALAQLAPGEWVTLLPRKAGDPRPSADDLAAIAAFCDQRQLHWQTA